MGDESRGFEYFVVALVVGAPAVFGLLAIVLGVRRRQRVRRLLADGERITAVVDGNQRMSNPESGDTFRPVVRFRTREGREVRTALDGRASNVSHLTEEPIDIVYDPADPKRAMPVGERDGGMMAVVAGLVFFAFSVGAYVFVTTAGFLD
ncbi:DUF3592 domain-containing protein [Paractinoplanes lichenicola]|uniref:DUF3592 domain-containing protein n=1 Tax=Paractinoplanes lichenicola TaxID=2802976 RepID=A0ABS1VDN6_9ACTN|nr:DUF3592 domain-containing protein [Actinoplanes lichenicola]MBL7252798.1 DUF3592 domain-containing protein [Actinoplanes lichenicola]